MHHDFIDFKNKKPLHVAIIMDGNGRFATRQGLPRSYGHYQGAEAVRKAFIHAKNLNIKTLTLFGMSTDNFKRPAQEVETMMDIFTLFLLAETENLINHDVKLTVIGMRERLPEKLLLAIDHAESQTAHCGGVHMRIAIDYSSRDQILKAIKTLDNKQDLNRDLFHQALTGSQEIGDVDLVIRTSGEQRLSDFLLWESAYAELWFTQKMWPEFEPEDLVEAVSFFHNRERRFGLVGQDSLKIVSSYQQLNT
ncbi:polyprenyl diphosphate synthase [Bartonella sp. HY329]|uniref:polyprenyl diphosphate synthase n=1 Tax=unclassified Bartonella TaxID=2645622 RepID=UPI0021C86009|nr:MULTISPECIES: polyprenyl diphosphate synthase [unclassified Bartonella]UXM95852.1 polyprenyl diphosphate synthase [Bartonella sp. HY329]UXN10177.1 polyprenyl diphosphate synthase [Bartonella sp. HY328]